LDWATNTWSDFEGRCVAAGIKWYELDGCEVVNLCYSWILSDMMNSETSRVEARQELDKRLNDIQIASDVKRGVKPEAEPFKLSPAMMAQMGIRVHRKKQAEQDSQ